MFDPTSRYANTEVATTTDDENRPISYIKRRFLPDPATLTTLAEVKLQQGERLDQLTARTLADPTQFWRICDANDVLHPGEISAENGGIKIPVPQGN